MAGTTFAAADTAGVPQSVPQLESLPQLENARAPSARQLLGVCALISGLWLLAASRWIVTDSVVPWDSKNQFYAFFRFLASSLHAGVSPFWNPYHYGGHPSVADPQSLIFAPLFVLWALIDPTPSLRTFDLLVFAHLLIGGLAIAAIGWRAAWPVSACVLAAVLFMFGGAAAGRLQHTGLIITYGLFPPAILLLQLALERCSLASAVGFGVVASALALGRNQVSMLMCFALAAMVIGEIATAQRPLRYLRRRAVVLIAMAIVGLALCAVPFLLTMQFAAMSNRPSLTLEIALKGSLYPAHLAQLMVPDVYGVQGSFWGPGPTTVPETAYTDDSFNYVFVGFVPIVLLAWFGILGGGVFRRGRVLITAIAGAALIYALGRYTPLFALAYDWVPGVDKFRRPVDANFVLIAALALICGHLLSDYVRAGLPRPRIVASVSMIAGIAGLLGWAVMFSAGQGHGTEALVAVLKAVALALAAIAILACARTSRARVIAAFVVTLIAVGDLLLWNVAFRLNAQRHAAYEVLEEPRPADAQVIDLIERLVHERQAQGERPRIEVVGMGGPWQNLAMVRGLEATNGYNPLRIGFYDRLVSPGEGNWRLDLRAFPASFDNYDCALARALGLEFVVLNRPIEQVPHLASRPVADVLQAGPDVWIYRLRNPSPRLKFSRRVQVADADATTTTGQLLASPSPDRVLIDDDTLPSGVYPAEASAGRAHIASWRPDRVEIETESDLGGMLALHDIYYPGWIAEIDGVRAPILRADVLFRGLEVPAGRHRIVFRFAPFALENLRDALGLELHRRG